MLVLKGGQKEYAIVDTWYVPGCHGGHDRSSRWVCACANEQRSRRGWALGTSGGRVRGARERSFQLKLTATYNNFASFHHRQAATKFASDIYTLSPNTYTPKRNGKFSPICILYSNPCRIYSIRKTSRTLSWRRQAPGSSDCRVSFWIFFSFPICLVFWLNYLGVLDVSAKSRRLFHLWGLLERGPHMPSCPYVLRMIWKSGKSCFFFSYSVSNETWNLKENCPSCRNGSSVIWLVGLPFSETCSYFPADFLSKSWR